MGKNEKVGKILWITKRAMRSLQIGAGFRDYKLGQEGLQIGPALGISNRGRDFKLEQRHFKSGQRLQNRRKRDFKSRDGMDLFFLSFSFLKKPSASSS